MKLRQALVSKMVRLGVPVREAAKAFGLSPETVRYYCKGMIGGEKEYRMRVIFDALVQGWPTDLIAEAVGVTKSYVQYRLRRWAREVLEWRRRAVEAFGWGDRPWATPRWGSQKMSVWEAAKAIAEMVEKEGVVEYREAQRRIGLGKTAFKAALRASGCKVAYLKYAGMKYGYRDVFRAKKGGYIYTPKSPLFAERAASLFQDPKDPWHKAAITHAVKTVFVGDAPPVLEEIERRRKKMKSNTGPGQEGPKEHAGGEKMEEKSVVVAAEVSLTCPVCGATVEKWRVAVSAERLEEAQWVLEELNLMRYVKVRQITGPEEKE
ncbi:MAG: hypothetical protein QXI55_05720 [Thermofilum sp.]